MKLTKNFQWILSITEVIVVIITILLFYKTDTKYTVSKILLLIIPLFFSIMLMINKEKTEKPIIFGVFTLFSMLLVAFGIILV
jgi:hypothetical protein